MLDEWVVTLVEACLAGAGNTGRVTQQADRTELYWGRRDEDVVQGQDLNYRTRRRMPVCVRCDLCDDVIRRAALQLVDPLQDASPSFSEAHENRLTFSVKFF